MFVRIAKFEGAASDGFDAAREQIEADMSSGNTPEGLERATEVMLRAMSPGDGGGRRSGVEMYEVAFRGTPSRA